MRKKRNNQQQKNTEVKTYLSELIYFSLLQHGYRILVYEVRNQVSLQFDSWSWNCVMCMAASTVQYLTQCCGSASPSCGSGFDLSAWCGSGCGSGFWFKFNADADPNPDPSFQIKAQTPWKRAHIGSYSIIFGLSSANWCGSGSGSSLSLLCGSGCWSGSCFLFDAMRIQISKMIRIRIHNTCVRERFLSLTCQRRGMWMQAVRKSSTAVGSMLSCCSHSTVRTVSLNIHICFRISKYLFTSHLKLVSIVCLLQLISKGLFKSIHPPS